MGAKSLVFLLLTVVGLLGITFITVPSLDFMFGLAAGDTDTTWFQVVGTLVLLWFTTGILVALTVWGIILTWVTWK